MIQFRKNINLKKILVFAILLIISMFSQSNYVLAEDSIESNNTNLKVLRLNHVGITPEFQKEIKEYYFLADMYINELEVTAIPENEKATVRITGNTDIKVGLNTINIEVESEDKTKTETYKIYVTKTSNKELANSNLENLAVREGTLEPPFQADITDYYVEIANDVSKLQILAIPQSMNAIVTIQGKGELQIGDNVIIANVIAEDGITSKKYVITVHRRSEQEEIEKKEEQEKQQEQLAILLENEQQSYTGERLSTEIEGNILNMNSMKTEDIITFILLGIVLVGFIVMFIVEKMKNK